MQHNVDKLAQRGENLSALQDKTDNLAVSAQGFNQGANRVRQKMWRSNMKWKIAVIIGIIILLCIIIIPVGMLYPSILFPLITITDLPNSYTFQVVVFSGSSLFTSSALSISIAHDRHPYPCKGGRETRWLERQYWWAGRLLTKEEFHSRFVIFLFSC